MKCWPQHQLHPGKVSKNMALYVWAANTEHPSQHELASIEAVNFNPTPMEKLDDHSSYRFVIITIPCVYITFLC